jgi:hypothetical protein
MTTQNVTPELVKEMYSKCTNKTYFISVFGTTRFMLSSEETLNKMYKFLLKYTK